MIVGIDPGQTGAIVILNNDGSIKGIHDVPTKIIKKETRKKVKQVDESGAKKSAKTTKAIKQETHLVPKEVFNILPDGFRGCIEKVSAMAGQGVSSTFKFGENYGILRGILESKADDDVLLIRPTEWQKHFNVTVPKKEAEEVISNSQIESPSANQKKNILNKYHKQKIAAKALEIYPDAQLYNSRGTLKDGRADALLIARYFFEVHHKPD